MGRLFAGLLLMLALTGLARADQPVLVLDVEGPILPVVERYLGRGLDEAERQGAVAVIRLDTPGGLVDTTRAINRRLLEAKNPVVVWVAPEGARAASAGVYMLYAAQVAAMAPGTHLGAATPVTMGESTEDESMKAKMVNDMAAYLRNLAHKRGRNAEWAEKSVREAVSLTADEAVEKKVVDFLAADMEALRAGLRERGIEAGEATSFPMSGPERFLQVIGHPQMALMLVMLGFYGLVYGFSNAGTWVPETVGAICLLLGLYALGTLPVNYAGVALVLLAGLLFAAELATPTHGALTLGGVISLVLGGVMLVPADYPFLQVSRAFLVGLALTSGLLISLVTGAVWRSLRRPPVSGGEALMGQEAVALTRLDPDGQVRLLGEIWKARSTAGAVEAGRTVVVTGRAGLGLEVEPKED